MFIEAIIENSAYLINTIESLVTYYKVVVSSILYTRGILLI